MAKDLIKASEVGVVTRKDIDDWLMGSGTKLTEQQKALFYQISSSFNLNPAKREIYAIPYGSGFNVIVGYEVYLKRAERTGMLEWWEATVEKRDDEWVGTCTIKRTDRSKPTTIEAWFNEYNQNNTMWKTKPRTMIRKVAIAQAFRMIFSDELGGMPYTSDETSVDPTTVELLSVETVAPPETPALDTSKFDRAVKKLKWPAETISRLEKWLTDTAAGASNKAGKDITPDMIKVSCANRFEEFLAKFKEWLDVNYPAGEAPPGPGSVEPTTTDQPVEEAEDTMGAPLGEEPSADPGVRSIEDRRTACWNQVIAKGIPLAALAVVKVSALADIDEININAVEHLIDTYQAPGKGKK
jgi:phage recombination protein Bet